MIFEVKVPAVGESVQEGEIYQWHKSTGDVVAIDDVLLEIETDKATVEIVAEAGGVLEIVTQEGATVNVGDLLAKIDTSKADSHAPNQPDTSANTPDEKNEKILSPAARRVATQEKIDVSSVTGTGRGGRITKSDVESAHSVPPPPNEPPATKPPSLTPSSSSAAPSSLSSPDTNNQRAITREKMSRMRQKIAKRLVQAQHQAAMLTTFNEVDLSKFMDFRSKYKDAFKEKYGVGLGFMSIFVKASVRALQEFPAINGFVDGDEIVMHNYCDIGIAVSTDKGLIVPVVRDCQNLSFADIEQKILDYAHAGREGKISVDDLSGGTFTISNGGVFGSLMSTPILNPPQSAILGMHKTQDRPVVVNGEIVVRPMMYLALSYDHRIVDGKEAVGFLIKIKENVEDPRRLLLGV